MGVEWLIEKGQYGPRMVMTGAWSSSALRAARSKKIKELELNYAKGWKRTDLQFLLQLKDLEGIDILDFNIVDVSIVNELSNLRRLKLHTYCKTELCFSEFPNLEECVLEWRPKASSLFEHRGLKQLFINKYPGKDMTDFSGMSSIESLSLASPRIETLVGIDTLQQLTFLGIYVARRLASIDGVESLTNLLQLEVNDCPKIRDIRQVAELHHLKQLHICNDGDIETFKPLSSLQNLEKVLFYESTNVIDGDLSPLKALPKLNAVAFMERPHYSHNRTELPTS